MSSGNSFKRCGKKEESGAAVVARVEIAIVIDDHLNRSRKICITLPCL